MWNWKTSLYELKSETCKNFVHSKSKFNLTSTWEWSKKKKNIGK